MADKDKKYFCKYCGDEFENTGYLLKHYQKGCPDNPDYVEPRKGEGEALLTSEEKPVFKPKPCSAIIPKSICPPEVGYFSPGNVVWLRVMGKVTEDGGVCVSGVDYLR